MTVTPKTAKAPDPRHGKKIAVMIHTESGLLVLRCMYDADRFSSPTHQVMALNPEIFQRPDMVIVRPGDITEKIIHNKRLRISMERLERARA